jgi:RNA polymerase sigma factor (sigma-70 family)
MALPFPPPVPNESALLAANEGLIYSIAAHYLRLAPAYSDDLCQEAILGALKAIRSYDPAVAKLSTWIATQVRGACSTFYRCRLDHRAELYDEEFFEALADEERIDAAEWLDLCAAWPTLPRYQQEIVIARSTGQTFREIGERIGCGESNVHYHYKFGVKRLRERIAQAAEGRP